MAKALSVGKLFSLSSRNRGDLSRLGISLRLLDHLSAICIGGNLHNSVTPSSASVLMVHHYYTRKDTVTSFTQEL